MDPQNTHENASVKAGRAQYFLLTVSASRSSSTRLIGIFWRTCRNFLGFSPCTASYIVQLSHLSSTLAIRHCWDECSWKRWTMWLLVNWQRNAFKLYSITSLSQTCSCRYVTDGFVSGMLTVNSESCTLFFFLKNEQVAQRRIENDGKSQVSRDKNATIPQH